MSRSGMTRSLDAPSVRATRAALVAGATTAGEVAERTGLSPRACRHALDLLAKGGVVRVGYEARGRHRGPRRYVYALAESGRVA